MSRFDVIDGHAREVAIQRLEAFGAPIRDLSIPASRLARDVRNGMELHHILPPSYLSPLYRVCPARKGSGNSPRTQVRYFWNFAESPPPTKIGYARRLWIDHNTSARDLLLLRRCDRPV